METWSIWLDPNNMFPALLISFSASLSLLLSFIHTKLLFSHLYPLNSTELKPRFDENQCHPLNIQAFQHIKAIKNL